MDYKNLQRAAIAVATFALMSACATMNESECHTANWEQRGHQDAARGADRQLYEEHAKACAEFGVSVDSTAYLRGWDDGIGEYCNKDKGWQVGATGGSYNKTCPPELEAEFFSAYQLGRNVSEKKAAIQSTTFELNEVRDDLERENISDEKRRLLRKDKKRLEEELSAARLAASLAVSEAQKMGFPAY